MYSAQARLHPPGLPSLICSLTNLRTNSSIHPPSTLKCRWRARFKLLPVVQVHRNLAKALVITSLSQEKAIASGQFVAIS